MSHQQPPTVIEDISAMYRTNYMGFASFTMLVWDHIDTFPDEVEYIWKGKKGLLVYLFLINRYLTPFGFIVNLFGTDLRCNRFIRFEGSMTVIGINIVALMMFLRIYALYSRHYTVLGVVIFLFLFQVCMNGWLLTRGEDILIWGKLACTMIFDPSIVLASSSAWLPLLYDTVIVGLTLYRTLPSLKNKNTSYVMKRLFQDGLIYYRQGAIFAVTAVLTIMIIAAPPPLKNITAQLELLTFLPQVAMMSRITLNLKKSVHKVNDSQIRPEMPSMFTQRSHLTVQGHSDIMIATPGGEIKSQTDSLQSERGYPMIKVKSGRVQVSTRGQLSTISQESDSFARESATYGSGGRIVEERTQLETVGSVQSKDGDRV
ncbi:hypothetical protein B0H34DRAFT_846735 [Crassisporium funariophilum]|nr:hypothetical protein B0H34DRAFT_846735 [Crassisporium funariophilum]